MTFDEAIQIYQSNTTHRSKWRDVYCVNRLRPHFTGKKIQDLKRIHIRAYIAARTLDCVKLSTVARELRVFQAAINFVRLEHDRPDLIDPIERIGIKSDEPRIRWITTDEATHLIAEASLYAKRPHLPSFIRLALATGCRKNELLKLKWTAIDWTRKTLNLEGIETKSGKRRTIPLNAQALDALRTMHAWVNRRVPSAEWVFAMENAARLTTLQKGFSAACRRLKIENFRIHDLRHTFASWLVMTGESLYVVKELLGHSSITVTERYAHLAPSQTRNAVEKMQSF